MDAGGPPPPYSGGGFMRSPCSDGVRKSSTQPIRRKPAPGMAAVPAAAVAAAAATPIATPSAAQEKDIPQHEFPAHGGRRRAPQKADDIDQLEYLTLEDGDAAFTEKPRLYLNTSISPTDSQDAQLLATTSQTDTASSLETISTATTTPPVPSISNSTTAASSITSSSTTSPFLTKSASYAQKAFQEARHFAGGLIHHPSEGNRHFSILRHSHGLVFYQGARTSLAISIFSDTALPPDRTLWMQNKGWTGNSGMRVKSLFRANGNWIDVTPVIRVDVRQLKPTDERAWQRDISSFLKRSDRRIREKHILRETVVVRIPVEANDGYFRLVLCTGEHKKTLCPSPVFRVLSSSTSPGSMRGASLMTLPLEVGAKILTSAAKTSVGTAIAPVTTAVQNATQAYRPPAWATTVYDATAERELDAVISSVNKDYDEVRGASFAEIAAAEAAADLGPKPPYPVRFCARVGSLVDEGFGNLGMPIVHLVSVPEPELRRFNGIYFGWARVHMNKGISKSPSNSVSSEQQWCQATICSAVIDHQKLPSVSVVDAGKREITITLIDKPDDTILEKQKIDIRVLGYIRKSNVPNFTRDASSCDDSETEALIALARDVETAQSWLNRPAWGPDAQAQSVDDEETVGALQRVKTGLVESRLAAQRHLDRVPVHRVGVRVPVDALRSEAIGNGGIYVVR